MDGAPKNYKSLLVKWLKSYNINRRNEMESFVMVVLSVKELGSGLEILACAVVGLLIAIVLKCAGF